jgi:hypothetical protein
MVSEKDISNALKNDPPAINIKTMTWAKDSYGLYDYQCKDPKRAQFDTTDSMELIRDTDIVSRKKIGEAKTSKETESICRIEYRTGLFWVVPTFSTETVNRQMDHKGLWKVVRYFKDANNNGVMIREGEIFKMGRISIKVRELAISDRSSMNNDGVIVLTDREKELDDKSDSKSVSERQCRICFRNEDCVEDPLFSPCKCAGSMMHIHFNCLKEWLKNKLVTKETNYSYSFTLKNLECELCKSPLQERFIFRGKSYSFLHFPKFEPPYMIFDILKKESKKTRGVCLLKLNYKPTITIGRGSSSDIRMNDISVSRSHATLKLTQQGLFLEDNNSKFGTLVLVREGFPILKNRNNVYLQVGRTLVQMNVKANWKYVMKHSKYVEQNNLEYNTKNYFLRQNNITEEDNIIEIADSEEDEEDEDEDEELHRDEENREDRPEIREVERHPPLVEGLEGREGSDSLLPREPSHFPANNGEGARVEHSSTNRVDSPVMAPITIQVQSRHHQGEISESLAQPQDQREEIISENVALPNNDIHLHPQPMDNTMLDSRISDTLNRATTDLNQDGVPPLRNQPTNVVPMEIRPIESVDLFVIQDNPSQRLGDNYGDSLQMTRFESNLNPQSPPTQLVESSPERDESPIRERLNPQQETVIDRRLRPLGTINSVKSDEDKEKSLHHGERAREDH